MHDFTTSPNTEEFVRPFVPPISDKFCPRSYPGDLGKGSSAPAPAPEEEEEEEDPLLEDTGIEAGVNYTEEAQEAEPEIETVETNEAAGSSGLGSCGTVVEIKKVSVFHPQYVDSTTAIENLFDSDLTSYFSVHRESTHVTFELEQETEVDGIAIGFFMKAASEERIQTFDVAVMEDGGEEWTTVISRKESSGAMEDVQTFPFSSRTALYVRLETHGNSFNNWSAFTEVEICAKPGGESNALFGGLRTAEEELEALAGGVCVASTKLVPVVAKASGSDNVKVRTFQMFFLLAGFCRREDGTHLFHFTAKEHGLLIFSTPHTS